MLTANDYLLMSYELPEYIDRISIMNLEELEQEKIDLMEIFNYNLKKRNDIQQQIEQTLIQDKIKINYNWLTKAKTALKFCKKDLNKINVFLSEIREKVKDIRAAIQEEKFSQLLRIKYPDIYNEIIDIIKNR